MKLRARFLLLSAALLMAGPGNADIIILKNGREIEGRILVEEEHRIQIESRGIQTWLSRDRIARIEESPEFNATLGNAEALFRRGDIPGAFDQLRRALGEGAAQRAINNMIVEYDPAISRAVFAPDQSARRQIRFHLRGFLDGGLLDERTLMLAARHFSDMEDHDLALQALARLTPEQFNEDPRQRVWALTFMRGQVRRVLDRGDFEGSLALVERMRRITGGDGDPMIPLTQMARAAAARDQGDFATAIDIILTQVRPEYPEIARNRIRSILDAVDVWSNAPERYSTGRELIARLDDFYPMEYQRTRNNLMEREASWLLIDDRPEEALALIESIDRESLSGELEGLRLQAFHHSELRRIGDSDPLELLKHGRWCIDNSLYTEALVIFNRTRQNTSLRELSDQLTLSTRRTRDTSMLELARRYHDEGDPSAVLHHTKVILNNPGVASELAEEAKRLQTLAEQTLRRDSERRVFDAVVLYQRAERSYFSGEHQDSLNLLRILFQNFPDTPAARQGTQLLPDVLRSLEIAYLEGNTGSLPALPDDLPIDGLDRSDRLGAEVTRLVDFLENPRGGGRR